MSLIVLVDFLHIIFDQQDPYIIQDPDNFDDPYFSFEEFVEKEVLDTEQDKELDSEEDPFEPSESGNKFFIRRLDCFYIALLYFCGSF